MSDEDHFVVIRVYQPSDEAECSKLIQEGVMSTVRPSFFTALTREVTIQVIITMAAVMFVFIGLSPTICILAVPVTIILIYIGVYVGHLIKVSSLADEAAQIPKTFLSSKYTCQLTLHNLVLLFWKIILIYDSVFLSSLGFWVAEAYEPYCLRKNPTQVKYTILKEDQLDFRLQNDKIYCKKVVGIVGIIRCEVVYEAAWLKRMSVNYKYQRKGIANALLDKAIEFCKQRGKRS